GYALSAADRSAVEGLLRGPGLEHRKVAGPGTGPGQRRDGRASGCDVRAAPVSRQPDEPLAGGRRLRAHRTRGLRSDPGATPAPGVRRCALRLLRAASERPWGQDGCPGAGDDEVISA